MYQYQLLHKFISILTVQFGPNLEILTLIGGELLRVQAQNGVNFYFQVQCDLQGQGQMPHSTISIITG